LFLQPSLSIHANSDFGSLILIVSSGWRHVGVLLSEVAPVV